MLFFLKRLPVGHSLSNYPYPLAHSLICSNINAKVIV